LRGVLLGTRDHPGLALHEARRHLFHWQRSGTPAGVRFKIGEQYAGSATRAAPVKARPQSSASRGCNFKRRRHEGIADMTLKKTSRSPLGETHQAVNSLANSLARVLGPRHRDL